MGTHRRARRIRTERDDERREEGRDTAGYRREGGGRTGEGRAGIRGWGEGQVLPRSLRYSGAPPCRGRRVLQCPGLPRVAPSARRRRQRGDDRRQVHLRHAPVHYFRQAGQLPHLRDDVDEDRERAAYRRGYRGFFCARLETFGRRSEDPFLPQSDEPQHHLADSRQGLDGDGFRSGVRGRGQGRRGRQFARGIRHRSGGYGESAIGRDTERDRGARGDQPSGPGRRNRRARRDARPARPGEDRRLGREAPHQLCRPIGDEGSAAPRDLLPGPRGDAAGIPAGQGGCGPDEGEPVRGRAGDVFGARPCGPDAPQSLRCPGKLHRGAGAHGQGAAHRHAERAGVGLRDGEGCLRGDPRHAGDGPAHRDRPLPRLDRGRSLRIRGAGRARGASGRSRYGGRSGGEEEGAGRLHLSHVLARDPNAQGALRVPQPRSTPEAADVRQRRARPAQRDRRGRPRFGADRNRRPRDRVRGRG